MPALRAAHPPARSRHAYGRARPDEPTSTSDAHRACAGHGGRDAVEHAHALWVDCDGDAAVDALRTFDPAPSIVIASGSGANSHAYWPLTAPLARDELERGNRRLAHALGADPASADAARILCMSRAASAIVRARKPEPAQT